MIRQLTSLGVLICLFGTVLGARWAVVGHFGTDLPVWDQWDAEGLHLLLPWFQDRPLLPALFTPHNEHYIVLTKLLTLGLTLLNGVWDQRLQCVVNASFPASLAFAFLRWGRGLIPTAFVLPVVLFLAAAWGLPLSWHNMVSGFHSQQFFLLGLSFAVIALLPLSKPGSRDWWMGAACAGLALLSMGSGFLAAAVAVGVVLSRLLLREIKPRDVWPTLLIGATVCVVGWATRNEVDYHAALKARDAHDFLLTVVRALQWPAPRSPWFAIVLWSPWLWLSARLFTRREPNPVRPHGWVLFGLGLWVALQIVATGYARGAGGPAPASRYIDTLVFGSTVNCLAMAWLWTHHVPGRLRRARVATLGLAWTAVIAWGFVAESRQSLTVDLPNLARAHRNAVVHTRAYLATGKLEFLQHPDSAYPGAVAFAERLAHPELLRLLPVSVRPSVGALVPAQPDGSPFALETSPVMSRLASALAEHGAAFAGLAFAGLVLSATTYWRISPRPALGLREELPHLRRIPREIARARVFTGLLLVAASGVLLASLPGQWTPCLRRLVSVDPAATNPIGDGSWTAHGIVATERPHAMRQLASRGSWVGGDTFTGEHVTGWYRAASPVGVMVAGYPLRAPNQLTVEVRHRDGSITTVPFAGTNPTERWAEWELALPSDAEALRLRAIDATTVWGGWLAFSEPYRRPLLLGFDVRGTLRTVSVVALALLLVLGPGLVWRVRRKSGLTSLLWVGPSWLALGGGLCWALGGAIAPDVVATIWVGGTILAIAWFEYRHRIWDNCSVLEKRVLALVALCVLGAASKAAFSGSPRGELYTGRVSRTLEVGARSDSRISFHGVQLIAHHLSPYEPEGAKYLAPWLFSARGPLAGLAAAPVVLATGGRPPFVMPDQPWVPFDREGFATYRIVLASFAGLSLVAVVALLVRITDERRAWLGAGLFALAPFFWHEVYFTWPKLIAAAWVVGGFHALLDRRAATAGVWLAGACLWHPLALLSVPFCGWWILCERRPVPAALRRAAVFGGVVLLSVAGWQLLNAGHSGQAGFLRYVLDADGESGLRGWILSRWNSTANTLIPFHVLAFNSAHPAFNALTEPSSGWIRYFLQYWTAAPFAVGLVTWAALLPAFVAALRRRPAVAAVTLLGPLLLLIVYWGAFSTGLMREGGHVLFLTGWIFLVWAAADRIPGWVPTGAFAAFRGVEVLAMMFLPTLADGTRDTAWLLNDAVWLLVAIASVAASAWLASRPHPTRIGKHSHPTG